MQTLRRLTASIYSILTAVALVLMAPIMAHAGPEDPGEGGQWGAVIDWPHIAVSAANLPDGRILTWSGSERETWPTTEQTYSATWDPTTGEFVEVFHDNHNMFCAHLAMLEDGRVFVNGGRNQTNSPWTSIFDFRDNEWLQIENMESGGRWYPTTLALGDGDVMTSIGTASLQQYPERWNIDDGWEIKNGIDFDAMVLDPFFDSGTHGESRWWPLLHVAPTGDVFHSGPTPQMHYIDPDGNGSFAAVGPEPNEFDFYHKHGTTIMYDEGKLLSAGGWVSGSSIVSTDKAFTIDISNTLDPTPIVAATGDMNFARKFHNGIMLPTGDVLVIGGNTSGLKFNDTGSVLETEIWDPDTGVWTVGASMATPRNYHSIALLLLDGRVLAAGSGYCSGSVFCNGASHKDGEVYSPPYLFNADDTPAARPSLTSGPARVTSGNTFTMTGTPGMTKFSMIKMGSTTHGVNTDVRFVDVNFTETSAGVYELTANPNQNVLTPGYWMVFGLNANDVPSVAHVVQANTSGQPWIATVPQQGSQEGENVSVEIKAGDMDDDPLVYSAIGLPNGLGIDANTGEITGAATAAGVFNVTVTVTDNDEGTKNRSFDWLVFGQGLGNIRRDWWTGINGSAVTDLTTSANYPDLPTGSDSLTSFEAPTNWADNYGTRVHGYVTPNQSGNYTFAIATDDGGELWLSTDSNSANRQLIASVPGWAGPRDWNKYAQQQSAPINLQANETYYIEALQKEGGGGDNLAVGWIVPGQGSIDVIPGAFLSPDNVNIQSPNAAQLDSGNVTNVGSNWVTVNLPVSYNNMVVVATPEYQSSDQPVVTRIRNASGSQFDVRVQNPGDGAIPSTYTVHYVVAEKGVYSGSGVTMEVATITSSVVDSDTSWLGESVPYQQSYAAPVVVGQVMGESDPDWSVFWASDGTPTNPPSPTSLSIGRHVGEDADTTRSDETLAYIVIDSTSAQIGNFFVEAGLGNNSIAGMDDAPPYSYALGADAENAVLAAAGMNGANGGWPALYGASPFSGTAIALAYDEDQLGDGERGHAVEEVAYLALAAVPDEPLTLDPIITTASVTDSLITFDAVAAGGANLEFNWNFGDGTETGFGDFPSFDHSYAAPGRYVISVTVRDPATGEEVTLQIIQLVHWPLTANAPTSTSTIALNESLNQIWSVNPDNDTVTVITDVVAGTTTELATEDHPVAVQIAPNGDAWVVNRKSATISVFNSATLQLSTTIQLVAGTSPYGLAFHHAENVAFVVQEGSGDLLKLDASTHGMLGSVYVGDHIRHVSVTADGSKVFVNRFITPTLPDEWTADPIVESGGQQYGGEVVVIEPFTMSVSSTIVLEHSERTASEHTGPGIPNYLGPAVISPDNTSAWVPSKQDNILAGALRGGQGMTFDQTVRAITSKIDLLADAEDFTARVDHDNASVGKYAAFGPYGVYLFTSLEGNREIAVSDAFTSTELIRFDVGRAPHGVTISSDGSTLYVHNFMDREVGVYDISAITASNDLMVGVTEINTISTVGVETLAADVLQGKQFFYDARDPRLALDSYMSCASCHNNGGQDGRIWDFTGVGEGLRNTIMLRGRAAMAHGFLHWSANFDELQDFEDQIRNFSEGSGLMDQADYDVGDRDTSLGLAKAGVSADLDALAAYVDSLNEFDESPHRNANGTLTVQGEQGRLLFESEGCESCHTLPRFTDSVDETTLHDIGTIKVPTSGSRLGGSLDGIDTPTLISLWNTGPYLHDGSAMDVTEAISAHTSISLTPDQLDKLGAYLEQLDSTTAQIVDPPSCTDCIDFSVVTTSSFSNQDADSNVSVLDGGATIVLQDNTWRRTDSTYDISQNTVLEVTFSSTSRGEIHGIGFDEDNTVSADRIFRLYGTQNWGIADFATYTPSDSEVFTIPVGQYFTGTGMRLILANDDDAGLAAESVFSNIRVYDPSIGPSAPVITDPGTQSSRVDVSVAVQVVANDANGDPLSFSATDLPTGLTISNDGLITGTPSVLGTWSATVTVTDNIDGSDSVTFDWTIEAAPLCTDCIDFTTITTQSFSNQDVDGLVSILNQGETIQLSGNTWRRTDQTYTIGPNTVLEFMFDASNEVEIQGIGFKEDESLSSQSNRIFQVWGTQNWGIRDFFFNDMGPQLFQIPVGQYYTGTDMFLVLVNDDDAGNGADSSFTNIRVYDPTIGPMPPVLTDPGPQNSDLDVPLSMQMIANDPNGDPISYTATDLPTGLSIDSDGLITGSPTVLGTWSVTVTATDNISGPDSVTFDWVIEAPSLCTECIDFTTTTTVSFANQDADGNVTILDNGATIMLQGNTWRQTIATYDITVNTVLEFTFSSVGQGEVHGIGFDEDGIASADRIFRIYGSQSWAISDFAVYVPTDPQVFSIPVGQYFTGTGMNLVLTNDDDAGLGGVSVFTDVRIYEATQ